MKFWKYKISIWDRLKFAWHAFWLQPISKTYPFAVRNDDLKQRYIACDVRGIGNEQGCADDARHCLSRPTICVSIYMNEHHHVCDYHNKERSWLEKLGTDD